MRRGELWWTILPMPIGRRPVLVLTRDQVLGTIDSAVVAIITRTNRNLKSEVTLGAREGLRVRSVASMDNLMTIPRSSFVRLIGACSSERLDEVNEAVKFAPDLR